MSSNSNEKDSPKELISLIIVDDHALVREGIQNFLRTQKDIQVLATAENGEIAVDLVKQHVPDVVLVDLIMPVMDGIETTRQIKQVSPHTQVIVLTSYHNDEHIFPALRAGALSYILKDIDATSLVDAIHRAHDGESVLDPNVATRVIQELSGYNKLANNPFQKLTDREMEVLKLIANGLSNREIADQLVISQKTVKVHVSNILSKLHLADRTRAAVYAWQQGIMNNDS